MKINLAENLKKYRKIRNITQSQVAEAMSVTPQAVSRWENGLSYPDITQLPLLAELFNVTLDELLGTGLSPVKNLLAELSLAENKRSADDNINTRKEVAVILGKLAKLDPVTYSVMYLMAARKLDERGAVPDILEDARKLCHTALLTAVVEKRNHLLTSILCNEEEENFVLWKKYITNDCYMSTWDDVLLMMYFAKNSPEWEKQRQENVFSSVCKTLLLLSNDVPQIKGRVLYNSQYLYPVNRIEILESALSLLNNFSNDTADIFLPLRIYIEYRYLISVFTYGEEQGDSGKVIEKGLGILENLKEHFRILLALSHGVLCHGTVPALSLVERKITYFDLNNAVADILINSSRRELDPIRNEKKFRDFIRFISMIERYVSVDIGNDDKQGENCADLTEFIPMLEEAYSILEDLHDDVYARVTILLDKNGSIHNIVTGASEDWSQIENKKIKELQQNGCLPVKKLLLVCVNGIIDLPSFNLRETLCKTDPENESAEILSVFNKRLVTRKIIDTFPKKERKRTPVLSQSEFIKALTSGRGNAVLAVEKHPERYRSLVLMACKDHFVYDPQCEGNRAYYVYNLIMFYPDKSEFIKTACESLENATEQFEINYFVELLTYIYKHGYKDAKKAVWDKYEKLYGDLWCIDSRPEGIFHEFDRFNIGFLNILTEYEIYRKVAVDVGRLYIKSPFYADCGFDFENEEFDTMLADEKSDLKEIKAFLDAKKKLKIKAEPRSKELSELCGIPLSMRLKNEPLEVVGKYADIYLSEKDPEKRVLALKAFYRCGYPEGYRIAPLINDARSDMPELRTAALTVLKKIRHPDVREFALELIENDPEDGFPLLAKNYRPEDSSIFTNLFLNINKHGFDDAVSWHNHHITVLDMFEESNGTDSPPTHILPMIYKMTPCSCCRYRSVVLMDKYSMLTKEILAECVYDSYIKTQIFAREKLKTQI